MDQQTVRKTDTEKLRPTSAHARALDEVLWRCRMLYNVAREQRITAWQRRHVARSRYEQEAELQAIRAAVPASAALHAHPLHDVLARLDKTSQAVFRGVQRGEQAGFPRVKGRTRFHSFTFSFTFSFTVKQDGNGARLDTGFLVLAKLGRMSVHGSRPLAGTPKTVTNSQEADGGYVASSCAAVPIRRLPPAGHETGSDVGLESFATRATGQSLGTASDSRTAEASLRRCHRRVARRKQGSHRRR